jgi:hypothetical protein
VKKEIIVDRKNFAGNANFREKACAMGEINHHHTGERKKEAHYEQAGLHL